MHKYLFLICFFVLGVFESSAQCWIDSLNMQKLYQYDDPSQPAVSGVAYNDVWGYVDPSGREYGIVGAADSILIFDVTDPLNIVKVGAEPGDGACIWRDMKTYGQYLYAGTECGEGLLVFDLSTLPVSFSRINQITSDFTGSHNIYIEVDSARLYVVGANGTSGANEGIIIYDLSSPVNPVMIKKISLDTLPGEIPSDNYYIHDIYVKHDTAYCSHGYLGYAIWDLSDVNNISRISNILPLESADIRSYVHSSWNAFNDSIAYVATEIGNRRMYIVDQGDPTNISLDTTWKAPLLQCAGPTNNVPHNPYVAADGFLYISYYQDGVNMLDISDPRKPIRIGMYDLDQTNTTYSGTTSNWGVYPFLPSGTIIATDTRFGFFALQYNPPSVPIVLSDFNVKPGKKNDEAEIEWAVASAVQVVDFELQRSKDGIRFETITTIAYDEYFADYEFIDSDLKAGKYYYRLKINDFDRSFEYSALKSIQIQNDISFSIYPTISDNEIQIVLSKDENWTGQIFSTNGMLIQDFSFKGNNHIIDVNAFVSGMYILKVQSDNVQFHSNFQVIK